MEEILGGRSVSDTCGYHYLEHMTDALAESWGNEMNEAFEQAGYATANIMVDNEIVDAKNKVTVTLDAESEHELLYLWLEEVIFKIVTESFAISSISVKMNGKCGLVATMIGDELDIKKHKFGVEIKAPTYHEMSVTKTDGLYRTRFLLDL